MLGCVRLVLRDSFFLAKGSGSELPFYVGLGFCKIFSPPPRLFFGSSRYLRRSPLYVNWYSGVDLKMSSDTTILQGVSLTSFWLDTECNFLCTFSGVCGFLKLLTFLPPHPFQSPLENGSPSDSGVLCLSSRSLCLWLFLTQAGHLKTLGQKRSLWELHTFQTG